ncbi:hypothetical protein [Paenibacillus sp. ALJ109b]|uniref:hypothetical protein n=1 Tax=Paenibacillus sp. ALJ109b TaxID=2709068 RepID=UPI0013D711DF|nr:hypothetical protein [Paenibacillus sp. ALJ109b]NEU59901.1 hypothetical protein [Paenibacillus sp. ALJ109b]
MERINPSTVTQTETDLISQIVITASPLAFISGQVAFNEKGELLKKDDYLFQAK